MKCFRTTTPLILAAALTVTGCTTDATTQTYNQQAAHGITKLQSWYSTSTGIYASPSGWWNAANSITVLADYERIANDNSYYSVLSNTFSVTPGAEGHPNFTNNYYDDMGWWALAWISAYDTTGNTSYLSMAETIFSSIATGWDTTTCGGGVWWNTSKTYKNAIANELFLDVAAKLANRTTGSTSAGYLNWAKQEWNWFKASGMINSSNLINDGLNSSNPSACVNNGQTTWTYNQGVILGGLVELYHADQDATLLPQAETIAKAVLSSSLVNANGVLVEPTISGGDNPQFKGIFVRNLRELYLAARDSTYQKFIDTNANSIWAHDQGSGYAFGALWQGAFDSADATRQTSALDALISAIAVQGGSTAGPIQKNGFGSLELFATDGSGNLWHSWQHVGADGGSGSGNWASWNEFTMSGVVAKSGPAVAMNSIGEQEVFVATNAGDVYTNWETGSTGGWNGWVDMGSSSHGLSSLHAVNSGANGGLYAFGLDASGNIWYASRASPNSSWSAFAELTGETVQPGFTVGVNAVTGFVEVFGVDSGGTVWTNTQTGASSWSGWSSLSGVSLQGYLAVGQNLTGHLQIFGIDTTNTAVWTNWQSVDGGGWQTSWQNHGNIGGGVTIKPGFVVGQNANGNLQVVAVGSDGNVYSIWQGTSSWTTSWASLSGAPLDPLLTVGSTADGRIQLFAISKTSPYNIESNWQTSQNGYTVWNGWTSFGAGGKIFYSGQP